MRPRYVRLGVRCLSFATGTTQVRPRLLRVRAKPFRTVVWRSYRAPNGGGSDEPTTWRSGLARGRADVTADRRTTRRPTRTNAGRTPGGGPRGGDARGGAERRGVVRRGEERRGATGGEEGRGGAGSDGGRRGARSAGGEAPSVEFGLARHPLDGPGGLRLPGQPLRVPVRTEDPARVWTEPPEEQRGVPRLDRRDRPGGDDGPLGEQGLAAG